MKSINYTKYKLYKKFLENPTTENERGYMLLKSNLTNTGPNLASKIAPTAANYYDYLTRQPHDLLVLHPLSGEELKEIFQTFALHKASGAANIPMRVIKLSVDKILEPLTEIINLSLESGCLPDPKLRKYYRSLNLEIPKGLKIIGQFLFFQLSLSFWKK